MRHLLASTLMASALLAMPACYSEQPDAQYPGEADEGNADLVEVSPGVEVIADWDEPIFFVDNFYWVNRGGYWYRSGWYGGGWGRVDVVPDRVRGISNPGGYVHYRPAGWAHHEPVRGYASHAQYHATHAPPASVHVRAAVHTGGGRHR